MRPKSANACLLILALIVCGGCAGIRRGEAVPREIQDRAVIAGMGTVRTWGDDISPQFRENLAAARHRRHAYVVSTGVQHNSAPGTALAISGGGANGAFGAGLLCGWTQKGDRPQFQVVTGISTGALIAPFAFLGPDYDPILQEVYTKTRTSNILRKRGLLAALYSDALADSRPLWDLARKHFNQSVLDAIAAEYAKGRLLLIGTVNLDARRSVIWDIGAIASSKHPRAQELVHSILIASAAIPAAFPPVMIDVEVEGRKYQEMHVDGGCLNEVFLYPTSFVPREEITSSGEPLERHVYVIRNSRVDPDWAAVERKTLPIAQRAISALIHSQGLGDLDRMFLTARRDDMDFNLAHIPATFKEVAKEPFDPQYMQKLFEVGFNLARDGYPWSKLPPGYVDPAQG